MKHVQGACPACGWRALALTGSGAIVCCHEDCARPTAAAELLADVDVDHVVLLERHDFTLRHPLVERLDDALLTCRLHAAIAASSGPPAPPGVYRVHLEPTGLEFTPIPGRTT